MAAINVNQEKLDELVNMIIPVVSTSVEESCKPLAKVLTDADESDTNAQSVLEGMKKFQSNHNQLIASVNELVGEFRKVPDLVQAFQKLDANRAQAVDTSFSSTKRLDASRLC